MALFTSLLWLPFLLPLLLLLKKKTDQVNKERNNLPPSPPKAPIISNLHQLGALPHSSLSQLASKYGPVMLLHLGRIPVVIVSSADAAKEVMKVNDLACCSRPKLAGIGRLTYGHLDVAFSPYSECWREMRKISVLEVFSTKRVKSFRFVREDEVGSLMDSISRSSTDRPVNLTDQIFALSGSVIFRTAFGKCFHGSEFDSGKFYELVHDVATVAGAFSYDELFPGFGRIIDWISGHNGRVERVFHDLDALFQQVIGDHLKPGRTKHGDDIIDVILGIETEQIEEHGHAWLTKNHIKAVLLNMFLGGIDTSALTVIWAMAELVRNPTLMKKAQDEVRGIVGNKGRVPEADLDQLQYLKMIIKETLRLHPPAPLLIAREAMTHFKINGYDVHPKTNIQINAWAIGRDPKYWKNPEEFSPDRFIDSTVDFKGQNFELLPFGSGRRGCPGIYMGTVTSELLLANLLYCFDWALPAGMGEAAINMEEESENCITLNKKTPLHLVPIKYLHGRALQ